MSIRTPSILPPFPFSTLAQETIVHIFGFLDRKSLGRAARVCRFFKEISADLLIWKPRHLQECKITYPWMGKAPTSWKEHTRQAKALHAEPPSPPHKYSLLFRRGFPNEEWARYPSPKTFKLLVMLTATGEWTRAATWLQDQQRQKNAPIRDIEPLMLAIFQSMEQKTTQETLQLYRSLRDSLDRRSWIGWWISNLMSEHLRTAPVSLRMRKEDRIDYYSKGYPKRSFVHLLEGFCLAWLQRGFYRNAFTTLRCLEHPLVSTPASQEEFRKVVADKIAQTSNSAIAWEQYGDSLLRSLFLRDNEEPLNAQYLAKLTTAIFAYGKALRFLSHAFLEDQMRLGTKLTAAVLRRGEKPANDEEFQLGCLPVLYLKKYSQKYPFRTIPEEDLCNIVQLVQFYEIDVAYVYLLDELKIEFHLHQISPINRLRLYNSVIQICLSAGREAAAFGHCIPFFYRMDPHLPNSRYLSKFQALMYDLMDENLGACSAVLAAPRFLPQFRAIKAYARWKTGDLIGALREISRSPLKLPCEELEWLQRLTEKNLIAAIIYSLQLSSEELDDFYANIIDLYPAENHFFLYHNFAVRLYFEGSLNDALESVKLAEAENSDQIETYILKAMIYQKMENEELSQEALRQSQQLDPRFSRNFSDHSQEDLLIFPVKELERLSAPD